MATKLGLPKVFISYSWKPFSNKQKTLELAERLSNDGVHVIIDEWDLSEGQDKYQFMEKMVNLDDLKRVLIICNQDYAQKANDKKGGVGVESLIISDEIYSQADQKKFVPVIFEKDENDKEYVPTFVKSRIYIDLSNPDTFEQEYEKLLRNIFDKPISKRPPVGTPPAYLEEAEPTFLRTSHKVKAIENALKNEKKNYQVFIDDYYSSFIEALDDFKIQDEEITSEIKIDELVLSKIEEIKVLRNDFIDFLNVTLLYSTDFDDEKFLSFLEKLINYIILDDSNSYPSNRYGYLKTDVFRFFLYELFLYLCTVLVDKENFKLLSEILKNVYLVYSERSLSTQAFSYTGFCHPIESIDKYRNDRLNLRRISITADTVKQRADIKEIPFNKLQQIDALLYYVAILYENTEDLQWHRWWPNLTAHHLYQIPIFDRLISRKYFEKFKLIFNVETIDEFKAKIDKATENKKDFLQRWNYEFPYLNKVFNFEKIGKLN